MIDIEKIARINTLKKLIMYEHNDTIRESMRAQLNKLIMEVGNER